MCYPFIVVGLRTKGAVQACYQGVRVFRVWFVQQVREVRKEKGLGGTSVSKLYF